MQTPQLYVTVGPSTPLPVLTELVKRGAHGVRVNFSHGDLNAHSRYFELIKQACAACGRSLEVLGDIQGPKLRIGEMDACELSRGEQFILDRDPQRGNRKRVCLPHEEFFASIQTGDTLLLNDGVIEMRVLDASKSAIRCECVRGGELSSRKGISSPGRALPVLLLTDFDRECIENGLAHGMNVCMLSFVQNAEHVMQAKQFIHGRCKIMSKIENAPAAIDVARIADISDYVMVARGDLGVETRLARVSLLQHRVQAICKEKKVKTVVVTQVLDAVDAIGRPSLAEVNDLANAVEDGFSGVMLTGEIAASKDPLRAFDALQLICHNSIFQ